MQNDVEKRAKLDCPLMQMVTGREKGHMEGRDSERVSVLDGF